MDITQLYVSQRNLRRAAQIPSLVAAILNGDYIPPIRLSETEDGTLQVDDGHHRVVAYWLSGRTYLEPHEYILTLTDRPRPRFGYIPDLVDRCKLSAQSLVQEPNGLTNVAPDQSRVGARASAQADLQAE